jgi:methylmalonyl-CoA/ethylmalonyl-CoA epimerase
MKDPSQDHSSFGEFLRVEHLGIAVHSLDAAEPLYTRLLGVPPYKRETVESEGVVTSFYRVGPNKIELLQSLDSEGPIARFLSQRGEGLHHVAYAVMDIRASMARLRDQGFQLLSEEPKTGADRQWVCFLHPRSAGGMLVEICQPMHEESPASHSFS